ncbi:MAG TPA: hypothetical protein VN918_02860, partial [Myxococcaceae bacterium]|nr:hypothetical protein [Myxococcaceae bacterium]
MRLNTVGCLFALAIASNAGAEDKKGDCPMHPRQMAEQTKPDSGKAVDHFTGVNERGDVGMGFSHQKTVHHFGLTKNGGFISA